MISVSLDARGGVSVVRYETYSFRSSMTSSCSRDWQLFYSCPSRMKAEPSGMPGSESL